MKKNILLLSLFSILISGFCLSEDFSLELQEAYNWSYKNGVTTQPTIDLANMKGNITRAELAKMMVGFSVNVMGEKTPTQFKCKFSDIENIDPNLEIATLQACDLGIMGQGITEFRPNDPVTRGEFGTVLSRVLWGNKYEGGTPYYKNHLNALKGEGIMNNISQPSSNEIRGYVMLMLMRTGNKNLNNINVDNQISEVMKLLD